jgi:hypothetical protein
LIETLLIRGSHDITTASTHHRFLFDCCYCLWQRWIQHNQRQQDQRKPSAAADGETKKECDAAQAAQTTDAAQTSGKEEESGCHDDHDKDDEHDSADKSEKEEDCED